jgi:sarcosine oxidase subunit gamma
VTAEALRRDLLAGRAEDLAAAARATGGAVTLAAVPFLAQVDLRLDPAEAAMSPFALPLEANTATEHGDRSVLWLGPDEWLVTDPDGLGPEIVAELQTRLAGVHHSVVDVSANRVALEVGGPRAWEALSSGCPLDLDPRSWTDGRCAQTLLARVPVILHARDRATRVLVRPSFAGYLVDWLLDAALTAL